MKNNIIHYFEETVNKYPEKIAVRECENEITFQKLHGQVMSYASAIYDLVKGEKRKPIALYLPKSIEGVALNLGIAYSGNIFMNMDIHTPIPRIYATLKNVEPILVITNKKFANDLEKIQDEFKVVFIEDLENVMDHKVDLNICKEKLIDTDPSCIINTSGSTGVPKSVVLNYRSFIDFIEWSEETFEFSLNTIIGSLSPCVFDIYIFELWLICCKGATMVILEASLAMFPIRLLELIKREQINYIFWVPTVMVNIANADLLSKCSVECLKLVWFAGEVFPTKQFNYWQSKLPNTKFVNMYGPIEITLDCTYFIVDKKFSDSEPLPIGYPCHNTDVLILNDMDEICKENEEGELCVRGTSLAMGYYNNPQKTNEVFVQNPLNKSYSELIYRTGDIVYRKATGEIMIKGRKDNLIKHLGYRIDLGEIEHVLINEMKIVKYCCAVYNKNRKEIILYYEAEAELDIKLFRKILLDVFPKYMLPTKYMYMQKMPMNTNGKIDRQYLKELSERRDVI